MASDAEKMKEMIAFVTAGLRDKIAVFEVFVLITLNKIEGP